MTENTPARPTVPADDVEGHVLQKFFDADGGPAEQAADDVEGHVLQKFFEGDGEGEGPEKPLRA